MGSSLTEQQRHHARTDPHVRGRWLSDLVLGAQDGIVNTVGVVLGVSAATAEARIVLAAGVAAAAAESISMAAVAYTSSAARGALFQAERAREYRHLVEAPDVERDEIRQLFAARGFEGELLERAVEVVCADADRWVAVMMAEEHRLEDVDTGSSLRSAAVVGGASVVAAVLPVLPFAFVAGWRGDVASMLVALALLLVLGATKARLTIGSPLREALKLAAIGGASALAAYAVARVLS